MLFRSLFALFHVADRREPYPGRRRRHLEIDVRCEGVVVHALRPVRRVLRVDVERVVDAERVLGLGVGVVAEQFLARHDLADVVRQEGPVVDRRRREDAEAAVLRLARYTLD